MDTSFQMVPGHRSRWFQRVLINEVSAPILSVKLMAVGSMTIPGVSRAGSIGWAFNTALLKFLYGDPDEGEKALDKIREIMDFFFDYEFLIE